MGLTQIVAGYVPLLDSAVLLATEEFGFAESEGIALKLVRETSWANIRDRIAIGHLDVAHMLGPMPISANLGLTPLDVPVIAAMSLGLGGATITVSNAVWAAMAEAGAPHDGAPGPTGAALRSVVAARAARGEERLRLAVVHPESAHNYALRYWLAASGIDPDKEVEIVIVPPPFQADALEARRTDGYCVGEPFGSISVHRGIGRIATTKGQIWQMSPDKVLGMRAQWAQRFPEQLAALLRAATRAARWCEDPANHVALSAMLAREDRLNVDSTMLLRAISGKLQFEEGVVQTLPDFFVPYSRAANFPWVSHAMWFYSQMVRWGQIEHTAENAVKAMGSYRPDLYRAALTGMGMAVPGANSKIEGDLAEPLAVGAQGGQLIIGPDGFFDGARFDPDRLDDYIAAQRG
ncbi:NitT/TauT family transport system ATP-binding protein [Devosia crocina]|uniref:NitT/TauT family transport system ATP-binding protein n=1 Tax=Devosia crocina TaxID=429728 RepID=A0A1I7NKB8_9HYPH|nr:CmpA/NrtA family ABC transporter substrate-binding protein [Devosia crocina]SFV35121.1 NitT/TauT family transport system ATP-binding protein [Devosia crocina]